jgi:hypothetical protein
VRLPVVLLYGRVPDWRAIFAGVSGADVSQLNHDLVKLGYADRADIVALGWDYYSWQTAQAGSAASADSLKGWAGREPLVVAEEKAAAHVRCRAQVERRRGQPRLNPVAQVRCRYGRRRALRDETIGVEGVAG